MCLLCFLSKTVTCVRTRQVSTTSLPTGGTWRKPGSQTVPWPGLLSWESEAVGAVKRPAETPGLFTLRTLLLKGHLSAWLWVSLTFSLNGQSRCLTFFSPTSACELVQPAPREVCFIGKSTRCASWQTEWQVCYPITTHFVH